LSCEGSALAGYSFNQSAGGEIDSGEFAEYATLYMGSVGKKWVAPEGSSLLSFYAFIASSKLYVGNESGPLQLADIAEIPLVAIYGPGVPDVFYPMSAQSRFLHDVLDCNPCDRIHCVRPSDRCIDRIGLAAVQFAVNEVLG
jgi:ADP-heptose:LPS heptosyltransferase